MVKVARLLGAIRRPAAGPKLPPARDELLRTPGIELLGELRVLASEWGTRGQHFRGPRGHVYELTATPAPTRPWPSSPGYRR
jgi:hypothetical protein